MRCATNKNVIITDNYKISWFLIGSIYTLYILTDQFPVAVDDYPSLMYVFSFSSTSIIFIFYLLIAISNLPRFIKPLFNTLFSFFTSLSLSYYVITNSKIDFNVIAASYESNVMEAKEFILSSNFLVNLQIFLFCFIFISYLVKQLTYIRYVSFDIKRVIIYTIISIIISPIFLFEVSAADDDITSKTELLAKSFSETPFIRELLLLDNFYSQRKIIDTDVIPAWTGIHKQKTQYVNYIVIIGESARRKNFGIYGYDLNTTTELDKIRGLTVVKDAISSSSSTRVSIPYMLNLETNGYPDYQYNIVDLINMSGLSSYWISNQGFIGDHDTPITRIAKQAKHTKFLHSSYTDSSNDKVLLDELRNIVHDDKESQKLIFLHTIGSHRDFCKRSWISFYGDLPNEKDINCYNSSIRNTSIFIDEVNRIVKGQKSKILYFSDHALVKTDEKPFFIHGVGKEFTRGALEIPMLFIDNTQNNNSPQWINKTYNTSYLVHTIAQWMGVTAERIDYSKSILSERYTFTNDDNYYFDPGTYKKMQL